MKKRIIFCVVFLLEFVCALSARGPKFYQDYQNGYAGTALADFLGYGKDAYSKFDSYMDYSRREGLLRLYPLEKLTNEESFLIWSALGEFDVRDGEVYGVSFTRTMSEGGIGVVTIKDNGEVFTWRGYRTR